MQTVLALAVASGAAAYQLRVDYDNPLLAVVASSSFEPFEAVESAFYNLGNTSVPERLVAAAKRGEPKANVLLAVLLRYCTVFLTKAAVAALCEDSADSECTCDRLASERLQSAHSAGSGEAAQALAARNWTRGQGAPMHVRLANAAAAHHDGAWPKERPPPPPAELPVAALARDDGTCRAAAKLLLPLANQIHLESGAKAAEVSVSLRRLETRWGGRDPSDVRREEHHAAAEAGLAWAVRARGYYALTADGVEEDATAARADFEASAHVGDGYATFNLGYMHLYGRGARKDPEEAVRLFEAAAAMGVAPALNALAVAYFNGLGVARDRQRAVGYLRQAVEAGDPDAMTNLAAAILGGEVSGNRHQLSQADFGEALQLLEASALRGRQGSLLELGALLVGSPRTYVAPPPPGTAHEGADDCPRGVAMLRLLVEMWGSCARALADGLRAYKSGASGRALMLYMHAAALGSSAGMTNAAFLLLQLDDEAAAVLPRPGGRVELARRLLRDAHELGNTDASLTLADMLYDEASTAGGATPPSASDDAEGTVSRENAGYAEALTLYEHVVRTVADPEAYYAVGHCHQHGLGTPRDLDAASAIFGELAQMESVGDALPGILAQLGVSMQRASSWLAEIVSGRWW